MWLQVMSSLGFGTVLGFSLNVVSDFLKNRPRLKIEIAEGYAVSGVFVDETVRTRGKEVWFKSDLVAAHLHSYPSGVNVYLELELLAQNRSSLDDAIMKLSLSYESDQSAVTHLNAFIENEKKFRGCNVKAHTIERISVTFVFKDISVFDQNPKFTLHSTAIRGKQVSNDIPLGSFWLEYNEGDPISLFPISVDTE